MVSRLGALLLIFATLPPAAPAAAQSKEIAVGTVEEEMAELNRSVKQLLTLIERIAHFQQADLMLRRLELKQRQMEPIERELQSKLEQRENSIMYVTQQEGQLERIRRDITRLQELGSVEERAQAEQMRLELDYAERQLEQSEEQQFMREQRMAELESRLGPLRAELRTLEEAIDDYLRP